MSTEHPDSQDSNTGLFGDPVGSVYYVSSAGDGLGVIEGDLATMFKLLNDFARGWSQAVEIEHPHALTTISGVMHVQLIAPEDMIRQAFPSAGVPKSSFVPKAGR